MKTPAKPQIGMLGIMQELYDDMLPGITERQFAYGLEVANSLRDLAHIHFPRPARSREDLEELLKEFNQAGLDGVMIVMLTYSPALRTIRALQENHLPILLANIQPRESVTADWDMGDLTYNQGVHGAQDMANALLRTGVPFAVITNDWHTAEFQGQFEQWVKVAQTVNTLKSLKIAVFGYGMNGMGDIVGDEAAFMRKLGPSVTHETVGEVYVRMQQVSKEEVGEQLACDEKNFVVAPSLTRLSHEYAARLQLAMEGILRDKGYGSFSAHFEAFGKDGRFEQLPMLAASNLLAKGYGYGAEGDTNVAALVAAGHVLAGDAHFTEMYAMDFKRNSILMSHMGEGNWKIARKDRPVRLVNRELGIGGLGNPPTVVFMGEPGTATLASLVALTGESYRLVVSKGEILDMEEIERIEMPYFHFRPDSGVKNCLSAWLKQGGTHHQCLNLGDVRDRWKMFCAYVGIEYVEV